MTTHSSLGEGGAGGRGKVLAHVTHLVTILGIACAGALARNQKNMGGCPPLNPLVRCTRQPRAWFPSVLGIPLGGWEYFHPHFVNGESELRKVQFLAKGVSGRRAPSDKYLTACCQIWSLFLRNKR